MSRIIKEKLKELIKEGKNAKEKNYISNNDPGFALPDYISGEQYDLWMNNVKIFAAKYCKEHILYDDIMNAYKIRNNSWGTGAYDNIMSYLNALLNDSDFIDDKVENTSDSVSTLNKSQKKIFISHSSLDINYVKTLVELLEDIGFKGQSIIFCSSVSGYGIPMGKHIYDYLKDEFDKDLHVIYLLSDNYYNSVACLNEMGAAWVKSKRHTAILVPEFNYNQIRGSVDASQIWFKMNDIDKICELKDELIGEFDLDDIERNYWERRREKYITEINKTYESNIHKVAPQKIEFEGIEESDDIQGYKCFFRFINKTTSIIKCTFINLKIEDNRGGKIEITLSNHDLNNLTIYNNENKRVVIDVDIDNCNIASSFNAYLWNKYEITESAWSKNI